MRKLFFILSVLISCAANAQTDGTIDKGSGWMYFSAKPSYTPNTTYGSEHAWDYTYKRWYSWNRTTSAWDLQTFDPTQPILRLPEVGDTVTGYDWYYFAPPAIALTLSPTTTVYEVGTSNSIDLRVVTTNSAGATLSNGTLTRTNPASNTVSTFGAVAGDTVTISFTPTQAGSGDYNQLAYSFQATQDYSGTESGSISSNTRSISGVYPVFYGMASVDTATVFSDIYGTLTKSVTTEGDKTLSYTGSGLIYYCFPNTWSDTELSSITDPNGFDATASFDRVAGHVLTSDDLTNDYTNVSCTCYVLNTGTTTTSASSYTFNQ
jgi:hypothetical protein